MSRFFLKVFVSGPFPGPLTYFADSPVKPGVRVKVPLSSRKVIGIVQEMTGYHQPSLEVKKIIEIIDDLPILNPVDFHFLSFAADYYQVPPGDTVLSTLPSILRQGKKLPKATTVVGINQTPPYRLTKQQWHAIKSIRASQDKFICFLLQGVTGSGKTQVFSELIQSSIEAKKQVLLLVPEIGLTKQMETRILNQLKGTLAISHSGLAEGARASAFVAASSGQAQVLIGTRSSLFTPMPKLGLILVDEEHDAAYKSQEGMRYSARDLAVIRAQQLSIPIVLSSATPSMESWTAAKNGKYQKLKLTDRPEQRKLPKLVLIDSRLDKPENGLTGKARAAIDRAISMGEQALLFLNRRGYSPFLFCANCGFVPSCRNCDSTPTLHSQPNVLWCHHCDSKTLPINKCPACEESDLLQLGIGTERLEQHLNEIFPEIPVIRIDKDTTSRRRSFERLLQPVLLGQPCILVGTQMLAKGHDFENLSTVVVCDADHGLLGSDFRSIEHFAQLITQVSGRAGRYKQTGQVFIQTHRPDSPWLAQILNKNYDTLATHILAEREKYNWPPHTNLALLTVKAPQSKTVFSALNEAKARFEKLNSPLRLLGPSPSPMERRNRKYYGQLLIVGPRVVIQWALKETGPWAYKKQGQAIFQLDVDPWTLW